MRQIGDRVGAILSAENGVAEFFGYGTYVGDEVPPKAAGGLNFGIPNPKIELDNGKTVFGCECWWQSEEKVKALLDQCAEVNVVDIDEARASA